MPAATAAALVVLMVASHNSPLLTHIANQGAPRAASRLGAAPSTSASTGKRPFVALQPITVVDNDAAVCNFIDAMRSLPEGSTLAIDAEWKQARLPCTTGQRREVKRYLQLTEVPFRNGESSQTPH